MAKISVIIPVYNTAEYLDKCMEGVLAQTFSDIEIMLVDDGSTDGISPAMCDTYAKRDPRVNVIHKKNGGLQSAWIAGTKESKANYVTFIDSDDWVDTDMCEKMYEQTDSAYFDSEVIAANYIVEKAGERRKEAQGLVPGVYIGSALDEIRRNLLGNEIRPITMSRCMKLISKKLILDNIKYCNSDIVMSEDVNIMLPCLCDCKRLVIMKDSYFYHYRTLWDSMSHDYNPELLKNLELTDKTFRNILWDKQVLNADAQMNREFVVMLFVVLKNVLRSGRTDTTALARGIFKRPDIKDKIDNTTVRINSRANKLLYFTIKHPKSIMISLTKALINYYAKKTNQL